MRSAAAPRVGPYLTARLRALGDRLRETAAAVVSGGDDNAVHDLRVATRRTRTVLQVGRRVFGQFRCDELSDALRALQRATAALRDEEVLIELVTSIHVSDPDIRRWLQGRGRYERRLRATLVGAIKAGAVSRALHLLESLLAFRVEPSRDRRLSKFARRAVAKARRRVERRRNVNMDDLRAQHRLRIAYKRLRYVAETFAGVLDNDLEKLAQRATRLQNRLGAVHDVDVAIRRVARTRALPSPAKHELLSALRQIRRERIAVYAREVAPLAYARLSSAQAAGTVGLRKISTR